MRGEGIMGPWSLLPGAMKRPWFREAWVRRDPAGSPETHPAYPWIPTAAVPDDGNLHCVSVTRHPRRWLPGYTQRTYIDAKPVPDPRPLLTRILGR